MGECQLSICLYCINDSFIFVYSRKTADSSISLDVPVLKWIGQHSYEIYLWQYPVIYLFQYKDWNTNFVMYLFELVILILLVVWSNYFLKVFKYKQIKPKFQKPCWLVELWGLYFRPQALSP